MRRIVERMVGGFKLRYVIDPVKGCHIWAGALHEEGYGIVGTNRRGTYRAHRIAYAERHGAIPDGLQLDHECRVRACINPDHLEPVTNAVNTQRGRKAKLTWESVREIRRLAAEGQSYRSLAAQYGVSSCAISNVVNQKRWKEVANG